MLGLSFGHLVILFFVILLFNARKLPELGSSLGKGLRAFKKGMEGQDADRDASNDRLTDSRRPQDSSSDRGAG
jgi:sec-independent protein translocase protein TatA